jgi:DNA-binding LytR/AlgR family response regulator
MIKCIIVEDEHLAQDILKKYIGLVPSLSLISCFSNASQAFSFLLSNEIDLIFLDINMPELNGIEFLKTLPRKFQVILTTAYSEFALEGYEYAVSDYLLKPIRYERFLKAIHHVLQTSPKEENHILVEENITKDHLLIKEDHVTHELAFFDVLYVEAFGNYLKIHTRTNKPILTRITMLEMEALLPAALFIRIHKSFIVSIHAVVKIETNTVLVSSHKIPLGATYKQEVRKIFRKINKW